MNRGPLLIIAIVFFLALLSLVMLLLLRRFLRGPYYGWRLHKIRKWGRILDRIIARMDDPGPAELEALKPGTGFRRQILEEVLLDRLDLMAGASRMPLVSVFEKTGLQKLTLLELRSKRVWTRRRAADRLGRASRRDVAPHLLAALEDPDADVRAIAAKSLGKLGVQIAAPRMVSLLPRLKEDDCNIIANTLIDMGPSMLTPLSAVIDHESEKVRYFSALSVSNICEAGKCRLEAIRALPARRATDLVASVPADLPAKMRRLARDWSPRVRAVAAGGIASLNDYQAATLLAEMLKSDEAPAVRAAAAAALGLLGLDESGAALAAALDDPDWQVRRAAARALSALGAAFVDSLGGPDAFVENLGGPDASPGVQNGTARAWLPEIRELAYGSEP